MKTLITTLMLSMGFLSVKASNMNSEFSIKLFDNSQFAVLFDNNWFGQPTNNFSISNVTGGSHELKIVKQVFMPGCWMPVQQTVFCGIINIPCKSKVFSMINNCGKYKVISVVPIYENGYGGGWGNNGNGCGNNNDWGNGNGWDNNGNNYGWGNNTQCMSAQNFSQLKYSINSKSFDSSKLQIAKQAIGSNYLSSGQVKELMELMSFESSKLELAKYAYSHTIDQQNYYVVNNAFDFESSIWELNKYING